MLLRLAFLLVPLLLLGGATGAEAYIGPGAGFAVLSSFLVMLVSFAMALASLVVWPVRFLIRWIRNRGRPRGAVDKVVIVGLDGLDPGLAAQFMKEGKLPNLSRLAAQGTFSPLAVSYPSISPAAWSSFMTGVDCSYHNIFDFLGRDPRNYKPVLSSAEIKGPRTISVGRWRIPVGKGRVKLLRKSKPFWTLLGEHGIFSTIIRVPITFPPEKFYGVCLSGMCAPDLRGSQGTFTHYTTRQQQAGEKEGGMTVTVVREQNVIRTTLSGPADEMHAGGSYLTTPMVIKINEAKQRAELTVSGQKVVLEPEGYSPWVPVTFKAAPGMKVHGICRFYLNRMAPDFDLYVTPIQIDPENPALPVASPVAYSVYLSKLLGRYGTLGLAEDTWALNEGVINEDAFLEQAWFYFEERRKMLMAALDKTRRGVCVCVFDTPDRVQHMFFRTLEDGHPANRGRETARYRGVIEDVYKRMDVLVGEVMDRLDDRSVLMVMSDHGFASFRRGVNINTWLLKNGYLALKQGHTTSGAWFPHIDWSRTRAYCMGLTGLFINRKGREGEGIVGEGEELKALKQELTTKLTGLIDDECGELAIREAIDASERFSGPYLDNGPDILLGYNAGYRTSWDCATGAVTEKVFEDNTRRWSGDHCIDPSLVPGIFFSNRPINGHRPDIRDIAPTVLSLFGIPVPRFMRGAQLMKEKSSTTDTKPQSGGGGTRRRITQATGAALSLLATLLGPAVAPPSAEAINLTKLTSVAVGSPAHDIVLDGQLAYVSTDTGLTILDITNPVAPVIRGSTKIVGSGHSLGVALKDGYAYLASQAAGLQIVDVRNPSAPVVVSVQKPGGAIWDVAVKDNIVYAVTMGGEMYLYNVSVPTKPVKVKTIGLLAWNAGNDATNLAKLRALVTAGNAKATGVSVSGNHLFAVDWNYGRLYYYNVTSAANPVFAGTHYAPFLLRVVGDPDRGVVYMFSAYAKTSGLYTVPISILSPMVSTRHETCSVCGYQKSNFGIDQGGVGAVGGGRYAFFAGGKGTGELHVVDTSDTDTLVDAAFTTIGAHNVKLAETMGLQARGDILYFAAGATGVQVLSFPGLSD